MATVAVVGAGPLGLMALKNLKEDGFDVTGYDARNYVGGLWQYSDDDYLSVQDSTIFNSSRYRSAISDFPFPSDTDDFPSWQQMHEYLDKYADHFDLKRHIRLNTKATGLRRENGKWGLEVAPKEAEPRTDWYDKVVVAVGSFVIPKKPLFEGIELFEGTKVHSINYHRPKEYEGKNVLLVGLHATTQDVAVSLSKYANKAYTSHKNGLILVCIIRLNLANIVLILDLQFPRYTADHAAFDQVQNLNFFFFQDFMSIWFPNLLNWIIDKAIVSISKKAFPNIPEEWNFSPAPSIAVTPPVIADEMYPLLESGFLKPCSQVKRITGPKSVELTDGTTLNDIDAIVYCTGYDMAVPFLPAEYNPYPVVGENPLLYRNIFPIHQDPAVRSSLAILGQAAVAFPGFVQHELISMAVSQIWQGKTALPSYAEMQEWHRSHLAWRADLLSRQKIDSTFYVAFQPFSSHFHWLDAMAGTGIFEHFGWCSRKAWTFWWRDRELYRKCKSGLFSPSMWRLFETGGRKAWTGAKSQIFADNECAERQIRERKAMMERKTKGD
jgi:dimethylaniline monooxygenase (N-oxide forming)